MIGSHQGVVVIERDDSIELTLLQHIRWPEHDTSYVFRPEWTSIVLERPLAGRRLEHGPTDPDLDWLWPTAEIETTRTAITAAEDEIDPEPVYVPWRLEQISEDGRELILSYETRAADGRLVTPVGWTVIWDGTSVEIGLEALMINAPASRRRETISLVLRRPIEKRTAVVIVDTPDG